MMLVHGEALHIMKGFGGLFIDKRWIGNHLAHDLSVGVALLFFNTSILGGEADSNGAIDECLPRGGMGGGGGRVDDMSVGPPN